MNRLFVDGNVLIRSGDTAHMTAMLEVLAGKQPSLADDSAFNALARELGDPISVVFLTRSAFMLEDRVPPPKFEKQPSWGDLQEWEVMAAGYGITDGQAWWAFALFFVDRDGAAKSGNELLMRIQNYQTFSYRTEQERIDPNVPFPEHAFVEFCGPFTKSQVKSKNGSLLVIRCSVIPNTPIALWWQFVSSRDIDFLVP